MTTVLVAPDKFKGSLTASEVAQALARGLAATSPDLELVVCPVADGGDGTIEVLVAAGFDARTVEVEGPTGEIVEARFACHGSEAVIELAETSGLRLLPGGRLRHAVASTVGLGQAMAAAIDGGARQLTVGLGGSAGTDGGVGMLQALGARVETADGHPVGRGAGALASVHHVDLEAARRRLDGISLVIAADVRNPLLGAEGSAAVFGPQKGMETHELPAVESALAAWARAVHHHTATDWSGKAGAGAAGGAGFALLALGATYRSGAEAVLDAVRFEHLLQTADLVVVGEGMIDEQTLFGKAPAVVTDVARRHQVPVIAVAGSNRLAPDRLRDAGIVAVHDLVGVEPDIRRCVSHAAELLERLSADLSVSIRRFARTDRPASV